MSSGSVATGGGDGVLAKTGAKTTVKFDMQELWRREQEAKKYVLWRQGQAIVTEAQKDKLVPFETGTLRRSAVVTLSDLPSEQEVYDKAKGGTGQKPVVVDDPKQHNENVGVAYVSYNTPYATALHESDNWTARREGENKWMEKAEAAARPHMAEIAANAIKERF